MTAWKYGAAGKEKRWSTAMIASSKHNSRQGIAILISALFNFAEGATLFRILAGSQEEVKREIINFLCTSQRLPRCYKRRT